VAIDFQATGYLERTDNPNSLAPYKHIKDGRLRRSLSTSSRVPPPKSICTELRSGRRSTQGDTSWLSAAIRAF
jgi:hypothetical protein